MYKLSIQYHCSSSVRFMVQLVSTDIWMDQSSWGKQGLKNVKLNTDSAIYPSPGFIIYCIKEPRRIHVKCQILQDIIY